MVDMVYLENPDQYIILFLRTAPHLFTQEKSRWSAELHANAIREDVDNTRSGCVPATIVPDATVLAGIKI